MVERSLGDNLSFYQCLEFFEASTPDKLKSILDSIRIPFKIVSMYSIGGKHIVWVNSERKIKKVKEK